MVHRARVALLVASLAASHLACGTSCPEIVAEREAFARRVRADDGPDARLALPFSLMDRAIGAQLARRPPVPVALPTDRLGIPLTLSLALDRVTTRAAADGRLGVTLVLQLVDSERASSVLELEVDTSIAPALERTSPPALRLRLAPADLGDVRPRPTADGTRRLGEWLRDRLPPLARRLATDEVVHALAESALDFVATSIWPHARRPLLGDAPLLDTRFVLPDLPIRTLTLRSSRSALVAELGTDLPDAAPLRPGFDRPADDRMTLRLSGGTATGLVNRAMDRGEVPARFDGAGKPRGDGPWEARLGWQGGGSPLIVRLWRTHDGCRSASVAARLGLFLEGDRVRVEVYDGRLTSLSGPAFAEAFAWLERLFGDAFAFTFHTAAFVRFAAGTDEVQLRLARIGFDGGDLLLDLDLGIAPR